LLASLRIAGFKHDVIALQLYDDREKELPPIGLVKMQDAESGKEMWVNTSSKKVRAKYAKDRINFERNLKEIFNKTGTDFEPISAHGDYIKSLLKLFKRRS